MPLVVCVKFGLRAEGADWYSGLVSALAADRDGST